MKIYNKGDLKIARQELRNNATMEEKLLWARIRNNQLGCKFRRQHSIGPFIVDFYSREQKIIIELDGAHHTDEKEKQYDQDRTEYFNELGIKVIRFWNHEIKENIDKVIEKIKKNFSI